MRFSFPSPIVWLRLSFFGCVLSSLPLARADLIVSDPVEVRDGWQMITQGAFSGLGLAPSEGPTYFVGLNTRDTRAPATNRGAAKYFRGVEITPGRYEITVLIGQDREFPFVGNLNVQLLADTNGDRSYAWSERIEATLLESHRPVPAPGEWVEWRLIYQIDNATKTAADQPVLGKTLGIMLLSNTARNTAFAFDSVGISRVRD